MADEQREQERSTSTEGRGNAGASGDAASGAAEGQKKQGGTRERLDVAELARDMGIAAVAGAALGAVWRVAQLVQPERADALKKSAVGAAREIASAAGAAAGNVVTSRPVNELLPTRLENGKRAEMVKSALKEAVAAAGDAAKDILEAKGKGGSEGAGGKEE